MSRLSMTQEVSNSTSKKLQFSIHVHMTERTWTWSQWRLHVITGITFDHIHPRWRSTQINLSSFQNTCEM